MRSHATLVPILSALVAVLLAAQTAQAGPAERMLRRAPDPRLSAACFTVERDLHCWRASFSRVFRGSENEWRYYFRIHVIQHQDELFLESGDRSYGGSGYGF